MIKTVKKDITTVTHGNIAHQVNCQGVMGAGVAAAIARKWPVVKKAYLETFPLDCPSDTLLGRVQWVRVSDTLHVANIFGQDKFGGDGKLYTDLDSLRYGLHTLFIVCENVDEPLYLPKIGSGLGGADWDTEVFPIIHELHGDHPIDLTICEWE